MPGFLFLHLILNIELHRCWVDVVLKLKPQLLSLSLVVQCWILLEAHTRLVLVVVHVRVRGESVQRLEAHMRGYLGLVGVNLWPWREHTS